MRKYVVRTLERPYGSGDFKLYTRQMSEEKFNEMVDMRGFHITPEYSETILDDKGNPVFMQYGMTFNSSLRHTACRVMSIEQDNQLVYQYGNEETKYADKTFEEILRRTYELKNCAYGREEAAA
jgi:hypothetical protein